MPYTAGQAQYKLNYEISPIILTGGIASKFIGGMLPLLALTQSLDFENLLSGGSLDLDNAFGYFYPLPGTTLADNQIGNYPFANQQVAANAIIAQPLACEMLMRCPCRNENDYIIKTAVMTSVQQALKSHNILGGTYTVATPAFAFTNCILRNLGDVSGGESLQAQMAWKWSFIKPLVTLQDATIAYNALMSQLVAGVQSTGDLTGAVANVGSTTSITTPQVAPAANASIGASVPASTGTSQ